MPHSDAGGANTCAGWYNANDAELANSSDGALEGSIDLTAQFGSNPTTVYLAVAVYHTQDGGSIVMHAPRAG